jgi:PAS domain S-box-containing protein
MSENPLPEAVPRDTALALRLQGIIQSAMDAIVSVDTHQRIVLFNRAAEQMFGCPAAEVLGQSLDRFIPLRSRSAHRQHIQGFGHTGVSTRTMGALGTISGMRANGEEFPLEASISQVAIDGESYFTVILRDITERVNAEVALRRSEAFVRAMLNSMPDEIAVLDARGTIVAVNEAWERFAREQEGGSDLDRGVGANYLEVCRRAIGIGIGTVEVQGIVEGLQAVLDGRAEGCSIEYPYPAPKDTRWLLVRATPLQGHDLPGKVVVSHIDITARKRAEMAYRESEERFQAFMNHSPAVAWMKGDDGRYVYVSMPFETWLGRSAHDILGKTDRELWPAVVARQLQENDAVVLNSDETIERTEMMPGPQGEPKEWLALNFPVRDAAGRRYVGGVAIDVTEHKHLEAQLRRAERLAELGTMASGMAHEIGTPMNVILGRAEYLIERTGEDATKKSLRTIVSQVERITKLMNQLLAFARRRPLERRPLDLRQTVRDALDIFLERLARAQVVVETNFDEECAQVYADADHMSQVLINLVGNAIHAMPDGGTLRIELGSSHRRVHLTVSDTGQGIAPESVGRIFEPFFTTKEAGKGTGLGLTVVKGILEEHHGTIDVASTLGSGTTFTVSLPAYHSA